MTTDVLVGSRRALFGAAALGWLSSHIPQDPRPSKLRVATVILVRHAEKVLDDSRDPDLTERGERRAARFAETLQAAGVTRLFTSDYVRTRRTLEPLAARVEPKLEVYDVRDPAAFAADLRALPHGSVAVVSGHSNTVPDLVTRLGGELSGLDAKGHLDESEYDRVVVQTLVATEPDAPLRAIQTLDLRLTIPD